MFDGDVTVSSGKYCTISNRGIAVVKCATPNESHKWCSQQLGARRGPTRRLPKEPEVTGLLSVVCPSGLRTRRWPYRVRYVSSVQGGERRGMAKVGRGLSNTAGNLEGRRGAAVGHRRPHS